ATASSGLTVAYSSSGACSNTAANFQITAGTGTCTVKYDQAGDNNYNAATQVTESVTAQKASQTITFNPLTDKTCGDADVGVSASACSTPTVVFAATGNCSIARQRVHISGDGS